MPLDTMQGITDSIHDVFKVLLISNHQEKQGINKLDIIIQMQPDK